MFHRNWTGSPAAKGHFYITPFCHIYFIVFFFVVDYSSLACI